MTEADISFTVISVDDHLVEPRHLFEGRMPSDMFKPFTSARSLCG